MHRTCAETGSLLQRSNQFTGALIARLRFTRQRAHDNILDRQRQIATEIARRNGRVLETRTSIAIGVSALNGMRPVSIS
jgi:hypothetical protein